VSPFVAIRCPPGAGVAIDGRPKAVAPALAIPFQRRKALMKDQLAEIAIGNDEDPLLLPGDRQHAPDARRILRFRVPSR
jgi:hypothetical protein